MNKQIIRFDWKLKYFTFHNLNRALAFARTSRHNLAVAKTRDNRVRKTYRLAYN